MQRRATQREDSDVIIYHNQDLRISMARGEDLKESINARKIGLGLVRSLSAASALALSLFPSYSLFLPCNLRQNTADGPFTHVAVLVRSHVDVALLVPLASIATSWNELGGSSKTLFHILDT